MEHLQLTPITHQPTPCYKATLNQQSLYDGVSGSSGDSIYFGFEAPVGTDPARMRTAIVHAFDSVSVYRSRFRAADDGLIVEHGCNAKIDFTDIDSASLDENHVWVESVARALQNNPTNMKENNLINVGVDLHRSAPRYMLNVHHSVSDATSLMMLIRNIGQTYINDERISRITSVDLIDFADFARWQNENLSGEAGLVAERFWQCLYSKRRSDWTFDSINIGPRPTLSCCYRMDDLTSARFNAFVKAKGVKPTSVGLTAYSIAREKVGLPARPVGLPVANRQMPELRSVQGYIANVIPVPVLGVQADPATELLSEIDAELRQINRFCWCPKTQISNWVFGGEGRPLAQETFNFLPFGQAQFKCGSHVLKLLLPIAPEDECTLGVFQGGPLSSSCTIAASIVDYDGRLILFIVVDEGKIDRQLAISLTTKFAQAVTSLVAQN